LPCPCKRFLTQAVRHQRTERGKREYSGICKLEVAVAVDEVGVGGRSPSSCRHRHERSQQTLVRRRQFQNFLCLHCAGVAEVAEQRAHTARRDAFLQSSLGESAVVQVGRSGLEKGVAAGSTLANSVSPDRAIMFRSASRIAVLGETWRRFSHLRRPLTVAELISRSRWRRRECRNGSGDARRASDSQSLCATRRTDQPTRWKVPILGYLPGIA